MATKLIPAKPTKPILAKHRTPGDTWKRATQKMFERVLAELEEIKKHALAAEQNRKNRISKGTLAGLERARQRGVALGRPRRKPKIGIRLLRELHREGLTQERIAEIAHCSQGLVSRLLKKKKAKGKK
jgi:DNA invertase Pin-like site-specific DNA recombinase